MTEGIHVFLGKPNENLDRETQRKIEDLGKMIRYVQEVWANDRAVFNISVSEWLAKSSKLMCVEDSDIEEAVDGRYPRARGLQPYPYPQLCYAAIVARISDEATQQLQCGTNALRGFKRSSRQVFGSREKSAYHEILDKIINGNRGRIIRVTGRAGVGKTPVVSKINNYVLEQASSFTKVLWVSTAPGAVTLCDLQLEIGKQINIDLSVDAGDTKRAHMLLDALNKIGKAQQQQRKQQQQQQEQYHHQQQQQQEQQQHHHEQQHQQHEQLQQQQQEQQQQQQQEQQQQQQQQEQQQQQQILLVLDLWKNLSREEIGIPEPSLENGYKVVIICRMEEARHSFAQEGDTVADIDITSLSERDTMDLFCEIIGGDDIKSLPEVTYRMLLDECECLPSLIYSLGLSIRERLFETSDISTATTLALASSQFSCPSLQHSYDSLSQQAQSFLLYRALFPSQSNDDIETEDLLWCWACDAAMEGEELAGNKLVERMKAMVNKGKERVEEIENAHLLKTDKEYIKMSKSVRKMAAQVRDHSFFIKIGNDNGNGGGQELKAEEVERASVMSDQLEHLGKKIMKRLSTLVVRNQHNHNQLVFPPRLFLDMPNVKVLDLSGTHVESFPKTFHGGRNLRALRLRGCPDLTSLPHMSPFLELLLLDISDTPITTLPRELNALNKLMRLNISDTPLKHFPFPDGLLVALSNLQELLMMSSYIWTGNESRQDLTRVTKLKRFEANFSDLQALEKFIDSREGEINVCRFRFCVGKVHLRQKMGENTVAVVIEGIPVDHQPLMVSLPLDNALHLTFNNNLQFFPLQVDRQTSLRHLTAINISDCGGLLCLFKADMLDSVPNLEKIVVRRCGKMVVVIEQFGESAEVSLGNVKELVLFQLEQLQHICDGRIKCKSLRSISVWECDQLMAVPTTAAERRNNPIMLIADKTLDIPISNEGMYQQLGKSPAPQQMYSLPTHTNPKVAGEEDKPSIITIANLILCFILMIYSFQILLVH